MQAANTYSTAQVKMNA